MKPRQRKMWARWKTEPSEPELHSSHSGCGGAAVGFTVKFVASKSRGSMLLAEVK